MIPTTLIDEILLNCHNSIEGGHQGIVRTYHRVKSDYYWTGLCADVAKHVQACEDCSTGKSKPQLKGYSIGNVISERPFQVVSMEFVIPLFYKLDEETPPYCYSKTTLPDLLLVKR